MFSEKEEEEDVFSVRPPSSMLSSRIEWRDSAEEADSCEIETSGELDRRDDDCGWFETV